MKLNGVKIHYSNDMNSIPHKIKKPTEVGIIFSRSNLKHCIYYKPRQQEQPLFLRLYSPEHPKHQHF